MLLNHKRKIQMKKHLGKLQEKVQVQELIVIIKIYDGNY